MNVHSKTVRTAGKRHHRPAARLPQDLYLARLRAGHARARARNPARSLGAASRRCGSMTRPAPIPKPTPTSISPPACRRFAKAGLPAATGSKPIRAAPSRPKTTATFPPRSWSRPAPPQRILRRGRDGALVTQYEFARAGIITEEMIYVAHRENLGREAAVAGAAERIADGESFRRGDSRIRHAGIRARRRSRAAARSSRPTSTIPNSSR